MMASQCDNRIPYHTGRTCVVDIGSTCVKELTGREIASKLILKQTFNNKRSQKHTEV